jgi:transcription initiation factor TFIID subunit 3
MTSASFNQALLQPAVLQILRAAGFNAARPAVLDTLTDLAARYLRLLAESTAQNATIIHNDTLPTVQDVRLALTENGALFPQMTPDEEARKSDVEVAGEMVPFEDLRGVQAFIEWAQGSVNKEIRRIAGVLDDKATDIDLVAAGVMDGKMDYLTSKSYTTVPFHLL